MNTIFKKYPKSKFLSDLQQRPSLRLYCDRLNDLYSFIENHEDSHFGVELDHDGYSRIWEMMVAKLLATSGFSISSSDSGPDFCAVKKGYKFYVEAVAPGVGTHESGLSVPVLKNGECTSVPVREMLIRISSAIRSKVVKHRKYISCKIIECNLPYVIAVSGSKFCGQSEVDPRLGVRCTLGYSDPYAVYDSRTKSIIETSYSFQSSVKKRADVEISMIPFIVEEYPEVSAVIYSDANVFSSSYDLFGQSLIIINPTARCPILSNMITCIDEIYTFVCSDKNSWRSFAIKRTDY